MIDLLPIAHALGIAPPPTWRPYLMGIVNATPDSFSDEPGATTAEQRIEHGRRLVAEGADLVDVGGESGVTNAAPVDVEEEIARVVPVIEALTAEGIAVSVDTYKPAVAEAALVAGARMVNDVSGLRDPELSEVAARHGAALVLMHTRAEPKQKDFPDYDDVMTDVVEFLQKKVAAAADRGVDPARIVLDPGPDFAKTPAQTVECLRRLPELTALGHPLLLAMSRKDFVGALTGRAPRRREAGTLAAVAAGIDAGAAFLRVHDVAGTRDFLTVRAALNGSLEVDKSLELPEHLRRVGQPDPAIT